MYIMLDALYINLVLLASLYWISTKESAAANVKINILPDMAWYCQLQCSFPYKRNMATKGADVTAPPY